MTVLSGLRVIEIEGVGPAPFCAMHMADLGADVILVERPGSVKFADQGEATIFKRGKRIIALDMKNESDCKILRNLIKSSDCLVEGMRPGVMEKLGFGPQDCLSLNPALVYGRVTGWGQDGPLSQAAGHDINYIGLSGALWFGGRAGDPPTAPPTLVGDIAGGALYLLIGLLSAILKARETGRGDVVDAAMVDGSAHMMNLILSLKAAGYVEWEKGASIFDGSHWFDSYACRDGGFITIGALEPHFYNQFLNLMGLAEDPFFETQMDTKLWPEQKKRLSEIFMTKTQAEWCALLEGSDVCFAPALNPQEAASHPHIAHRGIYQTVNGVLQASPAPRFANHPSDMNIRQSTNVDPNIILDEWSKNK